jgi:hypothetical protein
MGMGRMTKKGLALVVGKIYSKTNDAQVCLTHVVSFLGLPWLQTTEIYSLTVKRAEGTEEPKGPICFQVILLCPGTKPKNIYRNT